MGCPRGVSDDDSWGAGRFAVAEGVAHCYAVQRQIVDYRVEKRPCSPTWESEGQRLTTLTAGMQTPSNCNASLSG
eukprot:2998932-Amphidinium_carterae.1